jgi:hypothetical protein
MRGSRGRAIVVLLGFGSAVAFGCYTGPGTDAHGPDEPQGGFDGTDPAPAANGKGKGTTAHGDAATETPRGLPCDVAAVIAANCMECHGAVPAGGARNRLLTYEDFAAPPSDPTLGSVAELCLSRMKSTSRPMPPSGSGAIDQESLTVFARWVGAGLPRGMCAEAPSDGGAPDDPPADAPDSGVPNDPPVSRCTNGIVPDAGDYSELMRPGEACITCHTAQDGPLFEIAGTVYPTLHEPIDCRGAAGTTVVIIDATGAVHNLKTNESGNFFFDDQVPRPYRALVVRSGSLVEMQAPQTNGDCNSCHTEWGDGAPGRISIP